METPQNPKRLFVVFHGLFAFFQRRKARTIEVYIPDLRETCRTVSGTVEVYSPHAHRAGNWLAETEIWPGAELTLQGVTPGDAVIDRKRNIILKGPNRRSAVPAYARILFPLPAEVIPLREIPVRLGIDIAGKSVDRLRGNRLASIPVFRYDVPDIALLRLGKHPWLPAAVGDAVTLHVFAEPETPQGAEHSHYEFAKAFELFEGVDLRLAAPLILPRIEDPRIEGLSPEELEDLMPRTRRMAKLGRLRKANGNLADAWNDAIPFGENPTACSGGGADEDDDGED